LKLQSKFRDWLWNSRTSVPAQEQILEQVPALVRAEEPALSETLVASKIEQIRHFDVAGLERAVAICIHGRSGSELLASYLDGHDDVIMLPTSRSQGIYPFFESHPSLSLHDKLIAYAVSNDFFRGDFAISATSYYAAVKALFEVYGDASPDFLELRRTFFQFVHVAYCVALDRRSVSPRPLIVYAQHYFNDTLAQRFVEDFPQALFLHTVRDPITNCGRSFGYWFAAAPSRDRGLLTAGYVIHHLNKSDRPHFGMESRTRAIRFEDLHLHLEKTMRAVADWLELPYRSLLLDSTFNGVLWVVKRGTISWSGPRPEQATRDPESVSATDRGLLFAVFNEEFVAWKYPSPRILRYALVRVLTCMVVLFIPMKIEIITARDLIWKPSSRQQSSLRSAIHSLGQIVVTRAYIMSLLAGSLFSRLAFGRNVLQLL
jgi:sulfotransferase family protein